MKCPLCSAELRQCLLQPSLSIISCPRETCVFPFNLTVAELHDQNLLITDVTSDDIMKGVYHKMVTEAEVDEKIASFIARSDEDIK